MGTGATRLHLQDGEFIRLKGSCNDRLWHHSASAEQGMKITALAHGIKPATRLDSDGAFVISCRGPRIADNGFNRRPGSVPKELFGSPCLLPGHCIRPGSGFNPFGSHVHRLP